MKARKLGKNTGDGSKEELLSEATGTNRVRSGVSYPTHQFFQQSGFRKAKGKESGEWLAWLHGISGAVITDKNQGSGFVVHSHSTVSQYSDTWQPLRLPNKSVRRTALPSSSLSEVHVAPAVGSES